MVYRRVSVGIALVVVASALDLSAPSAGANAAVCGTSGSHTVCITVPTTPLVGEATINITNAPNSGQMLVVWQTATSTQDLVTRFRASGTTGDYSFIWPTQKYL